MHGFHYRGKKLYCEGVAVDSLAKKFGTPLYIYSQGTLTDHFQKLDSALAPLDHLVCFAMKSNSNLAVLRVLANLGSGFDIVSAGELQRVIAAGGDPRQCVFAGVAKTEPEIEFALRKGIYSFNVESEPEIQRINRVAARLKKKAPIAVRINPNINAHTHAKITTGTYENKFGIQFEHVEAVYARASKLKNILLRGVQMHIGSQLTKATPYDQAIKKVTPLIKKLKEKLQLGIFQPGWRTWNRLQSGPGQRLRGVVENPRRKGDHDAGHLREYGVATTEAFGPADFDRARSIHFRQRGHTRHAY